MMYQFIRKDYGIWPIDTTSPFLFRPISIISPPWALARFSSKHEQACFHHFFENNLYDRARYRARNLQTSEVVMLLFRENDLPNLIRQSQD